MKGGEQRKNALLGLRTKYYGKQRKEKALSGAENRKKEGA